MDSMGVASGCGQLEAGVPMDRICRCGYQEVGVVKMYWCG